MLAPSFFLRRFFGCEPSPSAAASPLAWRFLDDLGVFGAFGPLGSLGSLGGFGCLGCLGSFGVFLFTIGIGTGGGGSGASCSISCSTDLCIGVCSYLTSIFLVLTKAIDTWPRQSKAGRAVKLVNGDTDNARGVVLTQVYWILTVFAGPCADG